MHITSISVIIYNEVILKGVIYPPTNKERSDFTMSAIEAVFFGIIQGLAEFLPISSSGHLAFFHELFDNMNEPTLSFDILLHLGTLAAVCIVYYKDIWDLIRAFFSLAGKIFREKFRFKNIQISKNEKFLLMIFVAVLPLIPAAFLEDYLEIVRSYVWAIGILWILNGLLLYISDRVAAKRKNITEQQAEKSKNFASAITVGLCQVLAILPGISRSGMTTTGGMLCGFDREYAVKFSFILSIPAILGANILSIKDFAAIESSQVIPYICGMLAAMLSGLVAIKLLTYISKKKDFRVFSVYCFILGIIAIVLGIVK